MNVTWRPTERLPAFYSIFIDPSIWFFSTWKNRRNGHVNRSAGSTDSFIRNVLTSFGCSRLHVVKIPWRVNSIFTPFSNSRWTRAIEYNIQALLSPIDHSRQLLLIPNSFIHPLQRHHSVYAHVRNDFAYEFVNAFADIHKKTAEHSNKIYNVRAINLIVRHVRTP